MANATTISIAAAANVMRMPVATASGRAVTVPKTDAPVMSPRLRYRLSHGGNQSVNFGARLVTDGELRAAW